MMIPHDKFCVLPWVSLEASPQGTVRPCCLADDEIRDNTGELFRVNTASFDSIQHSDHMQQLRNEFLEGKQPATCRRCWAVEDSGGVSKRQHTLERLKHMGISPEWTRDAKPLMFLDLKLGNICNLKCRICGSWSSSSYAVEDLAEIEHNKKSSFAYLMLRQGQWPRNSPEFWQELHLSLEHIRYIEFTGGEPFMIDQHFDLLQHIVDQGLAHQVQIHYNTNGTIYPDRGGELWRHFQHVEIAFSIDDVGDRFEYQRSGAVWNQVVSNIARFRELRSTQRNIALQVCCTVNALNVDALPTVAAWIDTQCFDYVYWNILHDSPEFCISHLPDTVKAQVQLILTSDQVPAHYTTDFAGIVAFMMSQSGHTAQDLVKKLRTVDGRRQENYFDHHALLGNGRNDFE